MMAEEEAKLKPRRLRGHEDSTSCCIASRDRPHLIVTSGDDGRVCWFDLRCNDVPRLRMDVSVEPIPSLSFKSDREDKIYVSSGKEIKCFDVRLATTKWEPLENYNYNKEEINQVACNSKSSFLAAADDSGEVKIIDIHQQCLYKTLRSGHTSICSTVQFLPWRSWEVISGGLDSTLVLWDFSKGRPHKLADFEIAAIRSKGSSNSRKGSQSRSKDGSSTSNADADQNGKRRLHLDYTLGGHTSAVSGLAFSLFGERGKFIISGGNDKSVKLWNWSSYPDAGLSDANNDILHLNISVPQKVNWLCSTPADTDNLVVCDTSNVVKVYSIT
ncbi:uncharacterized protein LOC133300854 isoform X3 [Gastrolobium bilobum]|uniref:uncharacterized protein LOC133300854 isoform X3 n=1 Tax=Gastrolobium bilobum TaxID=150636 RepID=UPI002AB01DD0|nr:uncharacterized protein LOC133300854 isoform X3 [Gastrolobium bilobum]